MPTILNRAGSQSPHSVRFAGTKPKLRRGEFFGLLLSSFVISIGLFLVYQAKTSNPDKTDFNRISEEIKKGRLLNLNEARNAGQIVPVLSMFEGEEQIWVAERILQEIKDEDFQLPNVGKLAGIRLERETVLNNKQLGRLNEVLKERIKNEQEERVKNEARRLWQEEKYRRTWWGRALLLWAKFKRIFTKEETTGKFWLLTDSQTKQIRHLLIVRRPEEFRIRFLIWSTILILVFFVVHVIWRKTKFPGDQFILPVIHLLCGLGMMMMVSLRDPLRGRLEFEEFGWGILWGVPGLILAAFLWRRLRSFKKPVLQVLSERMSWRIAATLFAGAAFLALLLFLLGTGPGQSDARVNMWFFQPAEFIKILFVFALATYLAASWEYLRSMKHRGTGIFRLFRYFNAPRLILFLPVVTAMVLMLLLFVILRDLGPALILACTFLVMYAIARKKYVSVIAGLAIFFIGVLGVYISGYLSTVNTRIDIVRNTWDNGLFGGDQIAHSLWGFASGGITGMGLGMGDPENIPAGHNDLIISALGEELGFIGVLIVMVLYAILIMRGIRIALRAASDYEFFLAMGLTLITALQILLITMGILSLFPLSGVVSPFLSDGRTSMIANFGIFGLILAISARQQDEARVENFRVPVKWVVLAFGFFWILVVGRAADVQIIQPERLILKGVLTRQSDGTYIYSYNPRLVKAAGRLPRGSIYDRNGIPLASSDCSELKKYRRSYEQFDINIDKFCAKQAERYYPFGNVLFHLLGDATEEVNWAAKNTNYVERDYSARLRGYDDHATQVWRMVEKTANEKIDEEIELEKRKYPAKEETNSVDDETENQEGSIDRDELDGNIEGWEDCDFISRSIYRQTGQNSEAAPEGYKFARVTERDYRDLLPLLYHRYEPTNASVVELETRERNVRMSIDVGLQLAVSSIVEQHALRTKDKKAAAVVLDPEQGDLLAGVSYPWPKREMNNKPTRQELLDRALVGKYPPGSTFKIVTAMAALQKDDRLREKPVKDKCQRLEDKRVGVYVNTGRGRIRVRDYEGDRPHDDIRMEGAIVESCNAYFSQLGFYEVGAAGLKQTAETFGISMAINNDIERLNFSDNLVRGAFGQGEVAATPFQMARIAAAAANGGNVLEGRWVIDDSNKRRCPAKRLITPDQARFLAEAMRRVVLTGTAKNYANAFPQLAGKTGTAQHGVCKSTTDVNGKLVYTDGKGNRFYQELDGKPIPHGWRPDCKTVELPPHAWFIGFAPYDKARRVAFSVAVESGGTGAGVAAPIADEIVKAAQKLNLIQ